MFNSQGGANDCSTASPKTWKLICKDNNEEL